MICAILFLILLLCFPQIVVTGSKYGVCLWLQELLPTLLPFFIAIGLLKTSFPSLVSKKPLLLLGILCGYPTGAILVASQYEAGRLSPAAAYFYLGFVNNPSPMFVLAFCGQGILKESLSQSFLLFVLLILCSFTGSAIFYVFAKQKATKKPAFPLHICSEPAMAERLDQIILESFSTIVKVGGYVIIFSILGKFISTLCEQNALAQILCTGALEITCGISYIQTFTSILSLEKVLLMAILGFGGLSAAAQTASVLTKTGLSICPYILIKGITSILCGTFTYLLFYIF